MSGDGEKGIAKFEENLAALEATVRKLEGDIPHPPRRGGRGVRARHSAQQGVYAGA